MTRVPALLLMAWLAAAACTATTAGVDQTEPTAMPPVHEGPSVAGPAEPTRIAIRPVHAPWTRAIDDAIRGLPVSVAVGNGRTVSYVHRGRTDRILASNAKLLTTMAALDLLGEHHRFVTGAVAQEPAADGVVEGDLWLVGAGDPELGPERLGALAAKLRARGLKSVEGRVLGDTSAFTREWWAPGWLRGISRDYVTRSTALAFTGNTVSSPELAAASALREALLRAGVRVEGAAGTGRVPSGLTSLAAVPSSPLADLVARQNHGSLNFYAEMLAKAIGELGPAEGGSTAAGATVIEGWADARGVDVAMRDGSGLSHDDRAAAAEVVALLLLAEREPWFEAFESSLPPGGSGTLEGRLQDVPVRAKTGTLFVEVVSTLSGYVRTAGGARLAFSILSQDVPKPQASALEDRIVRIVAGLGGGR